MTGFVLPDQGGIPYDHLNIAVHNFDSSEVPGGLAGGVTPVPIPNTEVKPSKADDTAAVRQWDSRTLPGYKKSLPEKSGRLFCFRILIFQACFFDILFNYFL